MRIIYFIFGFFFFTSQICFAEELKPTLTVLIPMRDGVDLPTDLYLPSPNSKNLPCILLRSPAGRDTAHWKPFTAMSQAGYVIAIQDTRSALDPDGKTIPFMTDGWGKLQDGYDTIEWLAQSPYTNGKIGTWGSSALGITELLLAPSAPPHLVCQYMMMAAASLYHHCLFPGGQLLKNQVEGWLGLYARDTGVLNYISNRPFYNEFWQQLNTVQVAHQIKIPGLHIGGWYDTFLQGTIDAFTSRQYAGGPGAQGKQKLIIGPWTHYWPASQDLGDYKVPENAMMPPYDISAKSWFDHYLKDMDNSVEELPAVIYYVMGPFDGTLSKGNRWQTANEWPVPATKTSFYLSPDNRLIDQQVGKGKLCYLYDPKNLIETKGGRNLFLKSGPVDLQSIENRADTLIFTTALLEEDLEVTGNLTAKIYFHSDQIDTDIILHVSDVYPDGKSILITEGGYRLATMQGHKKDQPFEVSINLSATSMVFAKGHAMRLSISSSNYPKYERNCNHGLLGNFTGKSLIARNFIFTGPEFPSQLILPVIK